MNISIKGIKVRIASEIETRVKGERTTDQFGMYNFLLRKEHIGNLKFATFIFEDEDGRYNSKIETNNIGSFAKTYLDINDTPPVQIEIDGFQKTLVKIYSGNIIKIKAVGNIRVGGWVGSSDPDGIKAGVAGISLESYNIVRNINHAALMCRISGENEWNLAGKEIEFIAQNEGYLEFQINDNQQSDNEGKYKVKVIVSK